MLRIKDTILLTILASVSSPVLAFELIYVAGSKPMFAEPHDLVVSSDKRYVYVADNNHDRIAVLDASSLEVLGSFADNEVSAPHDVVLLSDDRLLVADTGNDRIAIYQLNGHNGKLTGELRGAIRRPEGVAVHPNGRVYATGAASNNIEIFENGRSIAIAGGLSAPHDVSIAADGSVWIADAGNDRLVQMQANLQVRQILKGAPYHFNGPRYLDFDADGRLYVADKYNHQIKVLTPALRLLYVLGTDRSGLGPGKFDRPEGIAIHGTDVWFSDTYNNRIVRYRMEE